jgi:hypothetical protein
LKRHLSIYIDTTISKAFEKEGSVDRPGLCQVDRKPAFWEYGEMKTTLDLPDKLMREVKIRAVHEHKKLKDVIAELLQTALGTGKPRRPNLPKPVKLRGGFIPTAKDIEAAIAEGRD